jgi:hypothetical protein
MTTALFFLFFILFLRHVYAHAQCRLHAVTESSVLSKDKLDFGNLSLSLSLCVLTEN